MAWSPVKSIYIIIVMVIKRIRGLENQNKLKNSPLSRTACPVAHAKSSITTTIKSGLFAQYKNYYLYNSGRWDFKELRIQLIIAHSP